MSGYYTGLQARIKSENNEADYVPCAAHSLNLVGVFAAKNHALKSCLGIFRFYKDFLLSSRGQLTDGDC